MKKEWTEVVITKIFCAMYVPPDTGKHIHKDRMFHGFVLNDESSVKDYCFSDGHVMQTKGGELFYLPKGSSYYVKVIREGGCYAINFDAEIDDRPFCVKPKNIDSLKRNFNLVCDEWRSRDTARHTAAMRSVYDTIYLLQKEQKQDYMPSGRSGLISHAIEAIERDFTNPDLTVSNLAALCGISEVYLRKIFIHGFGISPKEYIIRKRMEYAIQLLELGEFEVSRVAALCGYTEPCHFSREFKKRFGIAPKKYLYNKGNRDNTFIHKI